jgi:3-mercaptopyruvate sulfurtransferase SseA
MMIQAIATNRLAELYNEDGFILLDCRPSAAYNGWTLRDETRGGHIPGADSFPVKWFQELGKDKAREKLHQKGIRAEKPIIITGYGKEDIQNTANYLEDLGFSSIQIHSEGMVDWASDPQWPVRSLPRFRHLVHPGWLNQLLAGKDPKLGGVGRYLLAHVNFDNWGDYDNGHIPGAIWLDTLLLEDDLTWNCRTAEELEKELSLLGITRDTTVILYGRTSNPLMSQEHPGKQAGQLASMRAALLLMYAGVKNVRVLDGGLTAWLRAGGAITREETLAVPVKRTGMHIPEHPEYIADIQKAKQLITDDNSELVRMRSWSEFTGEVSGYHYIKPTGRIPGAVFGNNGSDAYNMENYRNHDDTMRNFHEITAIWHKSGVVPEKHIAFYCGTGWRASEAFFYAWLMGWERVSVYDGGWYQWSADPSNPIETGIPKSHANTT